MRYLIAALALASCASEPADWQVTQQQLFPETVTPIVLTGTIMRADHQTYREIPFFVPQGVPSLTIDFAYDKENRTVIDIGVRDPQGQRGWSGGNKSHIEIAEYGSTPSYSPGRIQPGEWKLVLGIPNVREGQTASFTATIHFGGEGVKVVGSSPHQPPAVMPSPPGWYRGDFHAHTAHSDGSCGAEGERKPCPTHHTADAARGANLDFVAVTDHNTITQLADINALQAAYPETLLMPGTEITTFNGHANVVGNTGFLDFQLGSPRLPTLAKLFDQVSAQSAFISINHPSLPSGEACMGCGWTVKDTDWSRVTAVEVINGASMRTSGPEGAFNGIAFWEARLRQGHRITAIAGSDNHDATDTTGAKQSPVGTPTTVVHADGLSTQAIIAGVKSGRVFIDVAGLPDATLDMTIVAAGKTSYMGGEVQLTELQAVTCTTWSTSVPVGSELHLVSHNIDQQISIETGSPPDRPLARIETLRLAPGASHGYIRPELRDADGKLLLLGNPIYFRRAG